MSPISEIIPSLTLASSNKLLEVIGSKAYPLTEAPIRCNHKDNQLPLNPVCPVKKTLLPCQN